MDEFAKNPVESCQVLKVSSEAPVFSDAISTVAQLIARAPSEGASRQQLPAQLDAEWSLLTTSALTLRPVGNHRSYAIR